MPLLVHTREVGRMKYSSCLKFVGRDESLPQYPEVCFATWPLTGPTEFQLYGYNWRSMFLHRPRYNFRTSSYV